MENDKKKLATLPGRRAEGSLRHPGSQSCRSCRRQMVHDRRYPPAAGGTPDSTGISNGESIVLDIKSGQKAKRHRLQTAEYSLLLDYIIERYGPNGDDQIATYTRSCVFHMPICRSTCVIRYSKSPAYYHDLLSAVIAVTNETLSSSAFNGNGPQCPIPGTSMYSTFSPCSRIAVTILSL